VNIHGATGSKALWAPQARRKACIDRSVRRVQGGGISWRPPAYSLLLSVFYICLLMYVRLTRLLTYLNTYLFNRCLSRFSHFAATDDDDDDAFIIRPTRYYTPAP